MGTPNQLQVQGQNAEYKTEKEKEKKHYHLEDTRRVFVLVPPNADIANEYIQRICEYYEIKCEEAPEDTMEALADAGVVRWDSFYHTWMPGRLTMNEEEYQELKQYLDENNIYLVYIKEDSGDRLYVYEYTDKDDFLLIVDFF